MSSAQAILVGAVIIAGSVLFVNSIRPAEAQHMSLGAYQLEHHSNPTANAGVFRIDTSSGEVSYCYLVGTSGDLTCSKSVK
jgi:hypothetical protein